MCSLPLQWSAIILLSEYSECKNKHMYINCKKIYFLSKLRNCLKASNVEKMVLPSLNFTVQFSFVFFLPVNQLHICITKVQHWNSLSFQNKIAHAILVLQQTIIEHSYYHNYLNYIFNIVLPITNCSYTVHNIYMPT